jgi:hypothetical protein
MATFTWTLQGGTPTTIDDTDVIRFAGGAFATPVTVSEFQDSTHVRNSGGTDDSDGNTPNNSKFISNDGGTGGDGQGDWGDGTEDIDQITTAECPLKINFAHGSSVITTNGKLYAYDGSTTTAVPTDVTFWCAEQGDANWVNAEGSAAAMDIADNTTATSHDMYFLISASPESVGLKSAFRIRIELTYS